jgi:hypothetical protein
MPRPILRIASIDIGRNNFAICIAKVDVILLRNFHRQLRGATSASRATSSSRTDDHPVIIPSVGKDLPRSTAAAPYHNNPSMSAVESVFSTFSVDYFRVVSLSDIAGILFPEEPKLNIPGSRTLKKNKPEKHRPSTFSVCRALTWFLDRLALDKLSFVVVEQQMSFGVSVNVEALKIAQHCASFFLLRHPGVDVCCFPAFYKTQVFGFDRAVVETDGMQTYVENPIPISNRGKTRGKRGSRGSRGLIPGVVLRATKKPERKRWAVLRSLQIADADPRHEHVASLLRLRKKSDDLADVFLQLGAFIVKKLDL